MTPEEARTIYHRARAEAMRNQAQYTPVEQNECDLEGWRAVIEAIYQEKGETY